MFFACFYSYGFDSNPILIDDVQCLSDEYLVLLQCSFQTSVDFSCNDGTDDVGVSCCKY